MSDIVYKNKTEYSKQFYKKIGAYKVSKTSNQFLASISIIAVCYYGATTLNYNPKSVDAWIALGFGFIVFPFVFFLLPYIMANYGYKEIQKESNGETVYVSAEISKKGIHCKNSIGQLISISYNQVEKVVIHKDLFVIEVKKSQPVYLSCDCFNDKAESVLDFIKRKTPDYIESKE